MFPFPIFTSLNWRQTAYAWLYGHFFGKKPVSDRHCKKDAGFFVQRAVTEIVIFIIWFSFVRTFVLVWFCKPSHNSVNIDTVSEYINHFFCLLQLLMKIRHFRGFRSQLSAGSSSVHACYFFIMIMDHSLNTIKYRIKWHVA